MDVRERFLHATVANFPLLLWWGPPWDPRVDDSYKRMILISGSNSTSTDFALRFFHDLDFLSFRVVNVRGSYTEVLESSRPHHAREQSKK